MFNLAHVAALKLVSAVFLFQQLKISFDFAPLLLIELFFHAGEGGLLGLLRDSAFESLALDSFLEERDLILVVSLDGIDHQSVLHLFLLLGLLVVAFFLKKFVFLKLTSELVDFLAEHNLLSIPLVIEGFLMRHEFLVEFAFADRLNALFTLNSLLNNLVLVLFAKFAGLKFVLILSVKSFKLLLLPNDATVRLLGVFTIISSVIVNLTKGSETVLSSAYILHEDVINVLIRLLTVVRLHHAWHSLFKNDLQLLLLLWCEILEVL